MILTQPQATDSELVRQILSGKNPELLRMAARGLVPLPPDELIPLQVRLAGHPDEEVVEEAHESLQSLEPKVLAHFLSREAPVWVLTYFGERARHPVVLEAMLRRRNIPREILLRLATELTEDLQEILLLRQDAIVEEPRILDALESNSKLSSYARRRIREYREHLLPREKPAEPEPDEELDEPTDEEVQAAIEEVRRRTAAGERDEEQTGLSETQIRALPIPVRLKLGRGASRSLRMILVRDPNPQVAVSVLKSNPISEQEIEVLCHNRSIVEEVLEEIARRREWVRKPAIVLALVQNPRTPTPIAMRFISRLSVRELRDLSRNRNVPEVVRSRALGLYKIKRQ